MNQALRAEHAAMSRRYHRIGAIGFAAVLVVMGFAAAMTGDWGGPVLVLLILSAGCAAALALVIWFTDVAGSRWSLLLWPAAVLATLVFLNQRAPSASVLLPGVIVLSFLFVGLTMARGASVLMVPAAVFVLIHTADLTGKEALVRIPIAISVWVVVAELPAYLLGELRSREAELVRRAGTDSLTGALNRTDLSRRVDMLGPGDVVALIDLDHFKLFNDQHGHVAGDLALTEFARVLMDNSRPGDSVFRYGGEEFLVIFPRTTIEQARDLLDRINAVWGREDSGLSFSAGLAPASSGAINRADALLYDAKDRGRAQVVAEDRPTP